jgi:hypothetical protein
VQPPPPRAAFMLNTSTGRRVFNRSFKLTTHLHNIKVLWFDCCILCLLLPSPRSLDRSIASLAQIFRSSSASKQATNLTNQASKQLKPLNRLLARYQTKPKELGLQRERE